MSEPSQFNESHKVETLKAVTQTGMEVVKALILINGGAAAGMVATLDKLAPVISTQTIQTAMLSFVIGLICALLSSLFAFFTHFALHEVNLRRQKATFPNGFRAAAILLSGLSLLSFAFGALSAVCGLK